MSNGCVSPLHRPTTPMLDRLAEPAEVEDIELPSGRMGRPTPLATVGDRDGDTPSLVEWLRAERVLPANTRESCEVRVGADDGQTVLDGESS